MTVFADEEEAALTGGTLRVFVAAVSTAAEGTRGFRGTSFLTITAAAAAVAAVVVTVIAGAAAAGNGNGGVGGSAAFTTVSGWIEDRAAAVDGAAGTINRVFEEFRAFIAFFNSFWNTFLIRSVA